MHAYGTMSIILNYLKVCEESPTSKLLRQKVLDGCQDGCSRGAPIPSLGTFSGGQSLSYNSTLLLGPGTHWHPREWGSRSPSESSARGPQGRHSTRTSIHLGGEQDQTNLWSKDGGEDSVGGRQMQQTSRLQAKRQSWEQETHPNE